MPVIGIGVDAVDVSRFRNALERRPGIVKRLFTDAEREYAKRGADPAQRFAARFAAKEAVMKAMGVGIGGARFAAIEVVRGSGGEPELSLHDDAAALAGRLGVDRWHLSLTHTSDLAVANVVAEGGR